MRRNFPLGDQFPHEGFIQKAVENHFQANGYVIDNGTTIDLKCFHPKSNEIWLIEAKGKTQNVGLDFRTGLGQLLQRMKEVKTNHALAMPDIPEFKRQCMLVNGEVRKSLNLSWLFVDAQGRVDIDYP